MRHPSKSERKAMAEEIDQLLRLPDFDWSYHGASHLVTVDKWRVWVGLGALTCKTQPAMHNTYVQCRLLLIFETTLNIQAKQHHMVVNNTAFFKAVHKQISKIDRDLSRNITPDDLGQLVTTYSAALRSAKMTDGYTTDDDEDPTSVRAKLRDSVTEWLGVLRRLRKMKKSANKKRKYASMAEDKKKEDQEDQEMDMDDEPATAGDAAAVYDFHPAQKADESLEDYVVRLQDKVRQIRTRIVTQTEIMSAQELKIKNQEWRIEELKELAEEDDEDDVDRPSSPTSPWVSLAEKRRRGLIK